MKDYVEVKLQLDEEQIPSFLGALAFLADECITHGVTNTGETREDTDESRHFGLALGYIVYLAAEIGAAVMDREE